MKKTIRRVVTIAIAAGLGTAGLMACDAPQAPEQPVVEESAGTLGESAQGDLAQEAPSQMGQTAEPGAQPQAIDDPRQPVEQEQPGQMAQQHPGAQPQEMGGEIDDETLDEFAEAVMEVQEIQGELQMQLQQAQSQEEAQNIQEEIVAQIQERVESTGMDFQEYMIIAQRIERDPSLQERFHERMTQ